MIFVHKMLMLTLKVPQMTRAICVFYQHIWCVCPMLPKQQPSHNWEQTRTTPSRLDHHKNASPSPLDHRRPTRRHSYKCHHSSSNCHPSLRNLARKFQEKTKAKRMATRPDGVCQAVWSFIQLEDGASMRRHVLNYRLPTNNEKRR
jgi:hypothetical protein